MDSKVFVIPTPPIPADDRDIQKQEIAAPKVLSLAEMMAAAAKVMRGYSFGWLISISDAFAKNKKKNNKKKQQIQRDEVLENEEDDDDSTTDMESGDRAGVHIDVDSTEEDKAISELRVCASRWFACRSSPLH
jgi:hypothetical protein